MWRLFADTAGWVSAAVQDQKDYAFDQGDTVYHAHDLENSATPVVCVCMKQCSFLVGVRPPHALLPQSCSNMLAPRHLYDYRSLVHIVREKGW